MTLALPVVPDRRGKTLFLSGLHGRTDAKSLLVMQGLGAGTHTGSAGVFRTSVLEKEEYEQDMYSITAMGATKKGQPRCCYWCRDKLLLIRRGDVKVCALSSAREEI